MALNVPGAKNALGNVGILNTAATQATVVPSLQSISDDRHITIVNDPTEILPRNNGRKFDATLLQQNVNYARPTNWTGWSNTQENQIQWTINFPGWDKGNLYLQIPVQYNAGNSFASPCWNETNGVMPDDYTWWNTSEFCYANLLTNLTIAVGRNGVNPNSSTSLDITAMKHVAASSCYYEETAVADLIGLGLPFGTTFGPAGAVTTTGTTLNPYAGQTLNRARMRKYPLWMQDVWRRHLADIAEMLLTDSAIGPTAALGNKTRTVYIMVPLHRLMPSHASMEKMVLPPGTPLQINLRTVSTAAANQTLVAVSGSQSQIAVANCRKIYCGIAVGSNYPPQLIYETFVLSQEGQERWNSVWMSRPLTCPIKWIERNLFNSVNPDPTGRYNLTVTFNQQEPVDMSIAFINNTNAPVVAYTADTTHQTFVGAYSPFPVLISNLLVSRTANALIQFPDLDNLYQLNTAANAVQARSISFGAMYDLYTDGRLATTNRDSMAQSNLFANNRLNTCHGSRFTIVVNPAIYNTSHSQGIDPGPTTINLSFTATNINGSAITPASQTLIITRENTAWFSMGPELEAQINNWPRVPSDKLGAQLSPLANPALATV